MQFMLVLIVKNREDENSAGCVRIQFKIPRSSAFDGGIPCEKIINRPVQVFHIQKRIRIGVREADLTPTVP
jgi:hypothetical protein